MIEHTTGPEASLVVTEPTPDTFESLSKDIFDFIQKAGQRDDLYPFNHFYKHFDSPEAVMRSLRHHATNKDKLIAALSVGENIVGVVGIGFDHTRRMAEPALYIDEEYRGKNIGINRAAIEWISKTAEDYTLVVSSTTPQASNMLAKCGYTLQPIPDSEYSKLIPPSESRTTA
jgi:GNAT superfamily N-acetyltransferase